MLSSFLGQLKDLSLKAQGIFGESVTIAGITYACVEGELPMSDLSFEPGGALEVATTSVIVSKQILQVEPIRGTAASFKGAAYRVTKVGDMLVNWQIHLIQLSA